MDWLVLLSFLTAVALAVPLLAISVGQLRPSRDYFALTLFIEIFTYLHLMPTLWSFDLPEDMRALYAYIQFACICLFELPFLVLYLRWRRRQETKKMRTIYGLKVRSRQQLWLAIFAVILAMAFSVTAASGGVLFMRLGGEGAIAALLGLNPAGFVSFRMFQEAGLFLIGVLLASMLLQQARLRKRIVVGSLLFVAGVFLTYNILNSRGRTIVTLVLLLNVVLQFGRIAVFSRRGVALALCGLVLVVLGYRVALNFRNIYPDEGFQWSILNPFLGWQRPGDTDDLRFRLNGIDLMARVTPTAREEGFAMGKAWNGMALVTLGQLTLGRTVDRSTIEDLKQTFMVSPKHYLALEYLNLDMSDYPSSLLTDLYGNFGIVGLPLGALVLAWCCGHATRAFSTQESPAATVAGIFVASHIFFFEQEFITLLWSLLSTLPALVLVLVFNPFGALTSSEQRKNISVPGRRACVLRRRACVS